MLRCVVSQRRATTSLSLAETTVYHMRRRLLTVGASHPSIMSIPKAVSFIPRGTSQPTQCQPSFVAPREGAVSLHRLFSFLKYARPLVCLAPRSPCSLDTTFNVSLPYLRLYSDAKAWLPRDMQFEDLGSSVLAVADCNALDLRPSTETIASVCAEFHLPSTAPFLYQPDPYYHVAATIPDGTSVLIIEGYYDPITLNGWAKAEFNALRGSQKALYVLNDTGH
ncbi:Aste57867_13904 [Aphanomyces stellatus]|uniref:Aste57867_13904 protein n=1 Tax=Aphanomyces stellatus TaxID=120398 RepID=A0A485KZC7_9STRA|nr:hypothetical protein As57867_013853 [Aphanomyces stellatus]VFT90735.1 Aste57867_13904 [Aphanomyces stellatus]